MMKNVENLGLALDRRYVEAKLNPRFDIPFDNQPTGVFKLDGRVSRTIKGDASILHESVKQRWQGDPAYRPKNLSHLEKFLNA